MLPFTLTRAQIEDVREPNMNTHDQAAGVDSSNMYLITVTIVTTVLPLLFDSYVLGITLSKTYHHAKEMREIKQRSVTGVLLRDGIALYFCLFPS